jgi:hypothetical protein
LSSNRNFHIILGTAIIKRYEKKRKQQIIGSTRRENITKTSCFFGNVTNKIPQVNIAIGPISIFNT